MARSARFAVSSPARHEKEEELRNQRAVCLLTRARAARAPVRRCLQQRVMLDYLGLANAVASRYRFTAIELRELRQVAYIGLAKAIRRFDPAHGHEIAAFAVPTITGEIKRYLRDSSWIVRPPRELQEFAVRLAAETPAFALSLGHEPSVAELAEATGRSRRFVADALLCNRGRHALSLDAPATLERESRLTLGQVLATPDAEFEQVDLRIALAAALRSLSSTEQRILYLRFFEELTQSEVAQLLDLTQMQVSRLLRSTLLTLRTRLEAG